MHFMQLRSRTVSWVRKRVRKRQNKIEILRFGPFAASMRVSKTRQVNFFLDLCREQSYI
jgi:hypothetical protein